MKPTNEAAENEALQAEVERLQLQLAACGVVAMANTPESAARQRDMHPDYMSASCQDVIRAVDREMALRKERDQLKAEVERLRAAHSFPHVSRFGKHLTLVFEADELSNDEKRSLFERARAMSWSHAIDDRKAAEKERDQLKARLGHCQRFLASGVLYTYDELLRHDAEVIEQWIGQARYMEGLNVNDIIESAEDYANQLRQQAKEVQCD